MKILFIIVDDLGWNDIGLHNQEIITPNLKELNACELKRNYTFTVCAPTRAMIQTGIYSFAYGFQRLIDPNLIYGLDENLKIIPNYLKDYKNFAIGKWHLGHNQKKWQPHFRGYDYHYGNLTGCIEHYNHTHCTCPQPTKKGIYDFSENGKIIKKNGHACDLITNKTIEVIEQNKDNDFFIYLAYNSPHGPIESPEEFKKYYPNVKEPRKSYLGMISHLDHNLGRIFNKLKNLNLMDDTLIWIQSDNGGWLVDWAGTDNYPLKGGKTSNYEGGVRTLGLIKHKDIKIKSYEGFCHSVDVLPTILDFANCPLKENLDGISLKSKLIENQTIPRDLVIAFYSENYWCFIFDSKIKIIKEGSKLECFDIINDPQEKNNIQIPEEIKIRTNELIAKCAKRRIHEPNPNSLQKIKKIKYYGQVKDITLLAQSEIERELDINKYKSFLELSGYDIFY